MVLVVCGALLTNVLPVPCQTLYRLVFQNRISDSSFTPGNEIYEATRQTFSSSALERRRRAGLQPELTLLDRPFDQQLLDELDQLGVDRGAELRWRNSVIVDCDVVQAMLLRSRPWVQALERVSQDLGTLLLPDCLPARYGEDRNQLDIINVIPLHDAGVYGQGASIGMIDVGFAWRSHPALAHADVRGEWDAVQNDSLTSNQEGDPQEQELHGTQVMSVAAGWAPGTLTGVAPRAAYYLAKTEDLRHERRIEDVHYAAAVEWLERNGVDVITASVGYHHFDSTEVTWPWEAFNGRTSFSARAVNQAAAFGVVCVTAAGNGGSRDSTIVTPADADSALSVGAVTPDQLTANFTSRGPTSDGRNKPDVLAPGAPLTVANLGEQPYRQVWGTSVAAPLVASSLAVLRSLYPRASMWELRNALLQTVRATRDSIAPLPWAGIIDVMSAAQLLGPAIPHVATVRTASGRSVVIPVVGPMGTVLRAEARRSDSVAVPLFCEQIDSLWWECSVGDEAIVEVRLTATVDDRDVVYPEEGWAAIATETTIPCAMRLPGSIVGVNEAAMTSTVDSKLAISRKLGRVRIQLQHDVGVATVEWLDALGRRQRGEIEHRSSDACVVRLPDGLGVFGCVITHTNGHRDYQIMMIEP